MISLCVARHDQPRRSFLSHCESPKMALFASSLRRKLTSVAEARPSVADRPSSRQPMTHNRPPPGAPADCSRFPSNANHSTTHFRGAPRKRARPSASASGRDPGYAVNSGPKLAENQRFEIAARPHLAVDLLVANLSGTPCPVKAAAAEGGANGQPLRGMAFRQTWPLGSTPKRHTIGQFQTAGFR